MAVADIVHEKDERAKANGDLKESPWLSNRQVFQVCQVLLAIFWPPLAVFLERGCGPVLVVNILLCILMYFPGMLHAVWVVYWSESAYDLEDSLITPVPYWTSGTSTLEKVLNDSPMRKRFYVEDPQLVWVGKNAKPNKGNRGTPYDPPQAKRQCSPPSDSEASYESPADDY